MPKVNGKLMINPTVSLSSSATSKGANAIFMEVLNPFVKAKSDMLAKQKILDDI